MSHDPLQKVLDELSGASTTPLSEMRPLFGSEAYELIGYIRRLEIDIASPGLHRSMMERFAGENAELRQLLAVARKDYAAILAVVDDAVNAGERLANTLRSTSEELQLCRLAYSEQAERIAQLESQNECYHVAMNSHLNKLIGEQSAHLATQRALVVLADEANEHFTDTALYDVRVTHGETITAARAAVAQAGQPKPKTCGECQKHETQACPSYYLHIIEGDSCAPTACFHPRADAQKGI
jgi:hypothetical protein